jgi:GH15 family glucan-1,4-alpha-glucosidase
MSQEGGMAASQCYLPIREYAMIGDGHGSALVGSNGSVDWCCLGRFDADPTFCRILDHARGGFLSASPLAEHTVTRSYLEETNVLRTVFVTEGDPGNELILTDFMPVGRRSGSTTHNYVDLVAPKWLVRTIEVRRGAMDIRIIYRPSVQFGRKDPDLTLCDGNITAGAGPVLTHDLTGFTIDNGCAELTRSLREGQIINLVLSAEQLVRSDLGRIDELLKTTVAFWREWIAYCRYRGPHAEQVKRSLLTIKMLIYAPSGALAAAPTTSLPEEIGGSRNWDYRYCWLRDTTFALYALSISGYGGEARRFSEYLPRVCAATAPDLRIMYGIDGETDLEEKVLDHLHGYEGSRPVRIGNGAASQRQIDVYGEVLDWALLFKTLGGKLNSDALALLTALADFVADHWREPDQGLWEMRGPPQHHVHGKIMSWVALDRAIRLVGGNRRWEAERDRIVSDVDARGGGIKHGHLVQAYGMPHVDAALLLTPMMAFPIDDSILRNTIAAVETELKSGDFVYRYKADDGADGSEGAFLICSFWLVDAYLGLGRYSEAIELFDRLVHHANDVGLFSEEIVPGKNEFLGNFPQAYTHLALIGSAAHFDLCKRLGSRAMRGSYADRAKLMVSATLGWRAVWAAFKSTWRIGRLISSKASILN